VIVIDNQEFRPRRAVEFCHIDKLLLAPQGSGYAGLSRLNAC
jgi:hypothetical protein